MNAAIAAIALFGVGLAAAVPPLLPADPPARQVRIEQHMSIRIAPSAPMMPPQMLFELESREDAPVDKRHLGRCLPVAAIAGVRSGEHNRLLLFMHDEGIVSATLEKSCNAADFYSGFYVEPQEDGMICVGRDRLQSRSGSNCRIRQLRALAAPAHRFP